MQNKIIMYDGIKSSLLWDETTDAWKYYSNDPREQVSNFYGLIPTIFRAVNMIANDVSKMPFRIMQGKKEIDNSQEYMNALEFLPNPRKIFQLISMSLDLTGSAYAIPLKNRAGYVKELKYVVPSTITPKLDPDKGLEGLTRKVGAEEKIYKPEEILYWWLADPQVEIGPPLAYPARTAKNAAGVLNNMDQYIAQYFDHSAIRPFIISVSGNPSEAERDRMENWFQSLWGGIKQAFRMKIFKADSINVQQVGDGIGELQNVELSEEKCKEIAKAFGIPYALLFSEAANNATLGGDQLFYYENTVEPRCEFIASVLQEQLFTPKSKYADYRLEFTPESLDIYQEDENARASSLNTYVSAGFPLLMACDVLGVELTKKQRAELEAAEAEKKQRAEELTANLTKPKEDTEEEAQPKPDDRQQEDIRRWRRKSLRALKAGKSPCVEFESDIIPFALAGAISGALETVTDEQGVKTVFESAWIGYP